MSSIEGHMISKWRLAAYLIEVGAVLALNLALLLPWTSEHGCGLAILRLAWDSRVAMGMPFNFRLVPISQWWIMWLLPMGGMLLVARAILGTFYLKIDMEGWVGLTRASLPCWC
jgi:hypothetical protein